MANYNYIALACRRPGTTKKVMLWFLYSYQWTILANHGRPDFSSRFKTSKISVQVEKKWFQMIKISCIFFIKFIFHLFVFNKTKILINLCKVHQFWMNIHIFYFFCNYIILLLLLDKFSLNYRITIYIKAKLNNIK